MQKLDRWFCLRESFLGKTVGACIVASVALPLTIGVRIGTVVLDDFEHSDCIFFFGENVER